MGCSAIAISDHDNYLVFVSIPTKPSAGIARSTQGVIHSPNIAVFFPLPFQ